MLIKVLSSLARQLHAKQLPFLPAEFGQCTELEILNLGGNPISSPIPAELCQLPNLVTLLCDDSNLTTLPLELSNLNKLIRCNVGDRLVRDDPDTAKVVEELTPICSQNGGWFKHGFAA